MLLFVSRQSRSLVAASKQSVVLGRFLAADTHLTRLQLLEGREGDAEALSSHRWSSRLQVLVPKQTKTTNSVNG